MMKRLLFAIIAIAMSVTAMAQRQDISGTVIDKETKEGLMQTTVQLLRGDSTYVAGVASNEYGAFKLSAPSSGKYIVKFTNVGYKTIFRNITVEGKAVALGKVTMEADAVLLKEVVAQGVASKVTVKEDTFVYNAAAYRVPEGSVVEELVKKLPGAQVGEDGSITINGKTVKKIMVDGKEFMTGDTKTAMKNLPTSIIDKVKAYDQKSDLARVTGIDDGDEQTVLDFGIKPGMNRGTMFNADMGYGTHDRYSGRLMGAYMKDDFTVMGMLNGNNVNEAGFPGGGGGGRFGGGGNGINTSKMGAVNVNYQGDKLAADGSVMWNRRDGDVFSRSSSENFVSKSGSFSNSENQNYSRMNSLNLQARLEWKPDTMTNVMFRPSYSFSGNDGRSRSQSSTFDQDPYLYVTDPLNAGPIHLPNYADSVINVNSNFNQSMTYSSNKNANGMLQYNRKLGSNGRNLTARFDIGYSEGESNNLTAQDVELYLTRKHVNDDGYMTNRYSVTPTKNWNYTAQATYSEPIAKATFLQFRYQFRYSYSKSDRGTYDFSDLYTGKNPFIENNPFKYRDWESQLQQHVLDPFGMPLEYYLDTDLSKFSEYSTYTHVGELMLRVIRNNYNFNVGVQAQPQHTKFHQDYQGIAVDTVRNTFNFTPTLDFRYRFSRVSQLRINYRATTNQPSMTQLLEIYDDSDPLNISTGNAGLKPEFRNTLRINYNGYSQAHMQSWMANVNFNTARNSIANKVTYNETTGGRITRPENINGNWDIMAIGMFNTAIDSVGRWNINTYTNLSYQNHVGYVSIANVSQKSATRNLTIGERLSFSYRNDWLEVEPNGNFSYSHARNQLQAQSNLDTWTFNYGLNVTLMAPWGTSLSTDWHMNSRRGYNDASMNTNEFVWNAQVSQSFLKGKPLTVSVQFYDILHNQSSFSRQLSSMQRSDTWYNTINSYCMVHVIYRLNLFGGKESRQMMRRGGDGPMMGPGPMGGGPRGGMGGGPRGGGFGGGGFGGGYGGGRF